MSTRERGEQESPRNLKHLAIHTLVSEGFLVSHNVAAKDTIDLVIGAPKSRELRTAAIRIKTSSYHENRKGWYFSESEAKCSIEKSLFFYIFCLDEKDAFKPTFVVISSNDLKRMTSTYRNGNYAFQISRSQREGENARGNDWTPFIDNIEQIKYALEK